MSDNGAKDDQGRPVPAKRAVFPLSMIIRPEFRETIQGMFGFKHGINAPEWYKKTDDDEVVDLWDLSIGEAKNFASSFLNTYDGNVDIKE